MNIAQVENNVKSLIDTMIAGKIPSKDFIYELLLAYGHRASTVSMLRKGHYNIAKDSDEIIFKRHLYFKQVQGNALHAEIDRMKNQKLVASNRTRFVICTNFDQLLAVDTKTGDSLDIALTELPRKFDFFLPWAGMEKAVYQGENPADVKAAEKMAKLFDLIKADNFTDENAGDKASLHNLNVFLTRLLFCFFAEDTEIFADNQFSNAIQAHTSKDGTDLAEYLNRLFTVLNTPNKERGALPDYLSNFPYVNGGLFADNIPSPTFSGKSRRMLVECSSELDWSDINPDIFGSMIQAVIHPDQRGGMGMHYTSVTNIMKVIEPLFLNELYEELDKVSNSATKLQKLQQRVASIKVFDPACGSGNFLIIAYKELRRFEMELLKRWQELEVEKTGQVLQTFSVIQLSQLYGIELDDFAHEVAMLSLWLSEHQMNLEFKTEFGESPPSLPLGRNGNIVCANALRIDWGSICTNSGETYVIGNPPYIGTRDQTSDQMQDVRDSLHFLKSVKHVDYICCWFVKASEYINLKSAFAFVATNSICQGAQVSLLWPYILNNGKEIFFANKDFIWTNNAKLKAGVTCSIIGVRNSSEKGKFLFTDIHMKQAKNINGYLLDGPNVFIEKQRRPISNIPILSAGNDPREDGHLILNDEEKSGLVQESSTSNKFIRRLYGTKDFLEGGRRWVLWIEEDSLDDAMTIKGIASRVAKVKQYREGAGKIAYSCKDRPHQFFMHKTAKRLQVVIPFTSSVRREYLPIGILPSEAIVTNALNVLFDPEPYIFGIVSSRIHSLWVKLVSGKHRTDIRYSVGLCYNAFPIPNINDKTKSLVQQAMAEVLSARESHSNKAMSEIYDPRKMPENLLKAHCALDRVVERIYSAVPFKSDEERLMSLIRLYQQMTGVQNA